MRGRPSLVFFRFLAPVASPMLAFSFLVRRCTWKVHPSTWTVQVSAWSSPVRLWLVVWFRDHSIFRFPRSNFWLYRDFWCQPQFFSSISPTASGIVQSHVFQLWLSNLHQWSFVFIWFPDLPRCVCVCANQVPPLVPHVILWLKLQWPVMDRLEASLASSLPVGVQLFLLMAQVTSLSRHFARLQ